MLTKANKYLKPGQAQRAAPAAQAQPAPAPAQNAVKAPVAARAPNPVQDVNPKPIPVPESPSPAHSSPVKASAIMSEWENVNLQHMEEVEQKMNTNYDEEVQPLRIYTHAEVWKSYMDRDLPLPEGETALPGYLG